jgi:predicted O-methyltransferase YrrM
VLQVVLEEPDILAATLNRLSNRIAAEGHVERALPDGLGRIEGFEDCAWLFSSNVVNHSASRLMLDEAAYLYKLVHGLGGTPQVVEIGRYHGGTTVLLAAAGGFVVSIDNDEELRESDLGLERALGRLGLAHRCDLRLAGSTDVPAAPGTVDVVLVDGDHRYEGVARDVEHWLPALRPNGNLLLHDARMIVPARPWTSPDMAFLTGPLRVADELRERQELVELPAPGTLVHFRLAP